MAAKYAIRSENDGKTLNNGADLGRIWNAITGVGPETQQEYSERMASTEYQRAVQDLKEAGLNPSVLYGQGAGHSASSSGSAGSGVYNAIGGNINSLIHAAVELHEDASQKNKNVAYHSAMQMIQKELKKISNNTGTMGVMMQQK